MLRPTIVGEAVRPNAYQVEEALVDAAGLFHAGSSTRSLKTTSHAVQSRGRLPNDGAGKVQQPSPNSIRLSQNTAGGNGRAASLRQSMGNRGWEEPPVDALITTDGMIDNTRAAIARELAPPRPLSPSTRLMNFSPESMLGRFGEARQLRAVIPRHACPSLTSADHSPGLSKST
jgi:hypothetical protein